MHQEHFYAVCLLAIVSCTMQQETKKSHCTTIAQPVNGQILGKCSESKPGDICSFSCNSGFVIQGTANLTCSDNGQWSATPPSCKQENQTQTPQQNKETETKVYCPAISPPANGQMVGMCKDSKPGVICAFSCNSGFAIKGTANLTCGDNGQWSSSSPSCQQQDQSPQQTQNTNKIQCPAIGRPSNGQMVGVCSESKPGDICAFSCNSGFAIQGTVNLTCANNGQWSAAPPRCLQQNETPQQNQTPQNTQNTNNSRKCPDILTPVNGLTTGVCVQATKDAICKFECMQGFTLQGLPSLLCNPDYTWSGPPPTCVQ